ncbi:MAG TPA: type IV secretion system protein [Allosphingosinicella sp.]|nr:type IV secretion system protein [Allosphingosinicella sp.]
MSGGCPSLDGNGSEGIAAALRVVDCESARAAEAGFGQLFGPNGALGAALTILLTLYVALIAINLLTGRSRVGLNAFTPRMLTLGLVLTFATSWMAYQSVVWALLTGAPDQIASAVTGQDGSATAAFAGRLDAMFSAVAQAAQEASQPLPATANGITPAPPQAAGWTAADVLWMAALLLLLGTVGVLLVARIALAALLVVGPVFIVLALFRGTNGLFVGWLKGPVMMALVPLFTVLLGGAALELLVPTVRTIGGGQIQMQAAVTVFLGAAVYLALMVMVLKVSGSIVAGWKIGGPEAAAAAAGATTVSSTTTRSAPAAAIAATLRPLDSEPRAASDRVRQIVAGARPQAEHSAPQAFADRRVPALAGAGAAMMIEGSAASSSFSNPHSAADRRVKGVGARFRAPRPAITGKAKA